MNLRYISYFFFLNLNFLYKNINGFLLKKNSYFVFFDLYFLHFFVVFFKNSTIFKMNLLMDIFVVDYTNSFKLFEITYCFLNIFNSFRFFFKTYCSLSMPVPSLYFFFSSANWLEREIWDLFGIKFFLHNDLRRILSDYGFLGHSLRKSFPLVGFVEISYDEIFQIVVADPLELTQALRFFRFLNPWAGWKLNE